MASPYLYGPYSLTTKGVDENVPVKSAGVYALGKTKDKIFYISRTGRSDDDVNGRLKQHVGNYSEFEFTYASCSKDAFEKECELYHYYSGAPGNIIHPARPANTNAKCPRCKIFD